MSPKENALVLLQEHRDLLARTLARQILQVAPSYSAIDEGVRVRSILGIIDAFSALLKGGERERVASLVRDLVTVRIAGGVTPADFLASAHVYMPVVRWVFVEEAADPLTGLWAFEEVEAVALPLLCRFGAVVLSAQEDATSAPPASSLEAFETLFTAEDRFVAVADTSEEETGRS